MNSDNKCLKNDVDVVQISSNSLKDQMKCVINLVNNLDKEDDYTKGLMIGGVISLILCIGLFFMAKFKASTLLV